MTKPSFEPPKELYDKFDEFLALLFEMHAIRETLYNPVNQRIDATLDMMGEEGGFRIRTSDATIFVSLRSELTDEGRKVLDRSIGFQDYVDPVRACKAAIDQLQGFCDELNAAKEPEPEVLIVTQVQGRGDYRYKEYKISHLWLNWFRRVLPHYPPEAPMEMAAFHAAKKHFQESPTDRIERVFSNSYVPQDQDVEIEFYRVTRVKL